MGYEYINESDANGNETGYCILPDKSKVDAWEFFRGEVKNEFSYCARKGFGLERKVVKRNGYEYVCPHCINDRFDGKNLSDSISAFDDFTEIPMLELMERNSEPLIDKQKIFREEKPFLKNNEITNLTIQENSTVTTKLKSTVTLPDSWDWRDVDDYNYVNPIRNQREAGSDCGTCYAFASVACAEGAYNKFFDLYNDNRIQFSESFLAWCLGSLDHYNFYGCEGADPGEYEELEALTNEGIIERNYYPYPPPPGGGCEHWDYPRVAFSGWQHVTCNDIDAIKTAIMNYGVVYASMYVEDDFYDYNGEPLIYYNHWDDCNYSLTNHGVALVGWGTYNGDDTYWILRNSWGYGWGINGYAYIDAGSSLISSKVANFVPNPITFKYFGYDMSESGIIENGTHVEYIFRNSLILNPGFEVEVGAEFKAYVGPNH